MPVQIISFDLQPIYVCYFKDGGLAYSVGGIGANYPPTRSFTFPMSGPNGDKLVIPVGLDTALTLGWINEGEYADELGITKELKAVAALLNRD